MRARVTLLATIAAIVGVAGCKDSGLPDRNLPFDEAAHRPPDALVQAVHPETRAGADASAAGGMPQDDAHAGAASMATRPIAIGEQTFVASGHPSSMDAGALSQVGNVGGMGFFAATGDEAPYDRLYMAHGEAGYITYMPVHDGGDASQRQATFEHSLESGATAAH